MPVIEIRPSNVAEMRANASALFDAHWRELCKDRDRRKLEPDWNRYLHLENSGDLFVLAAWIGEELVGYSANMVTRHIHYSAVVYAQNDILFVAPNHRGGSVGGRLVKATEDQAREIGASEMIWHAKPGSQLDRSLTNSEDYSVMDVLHLRVL